MAYHRTVKISTRNWNHKPSSGRIKAVDDDDDNDVDEVLKILLGFEPF